MNIESQIAVMILGHWGYFVTVGDIDGRNFEAEFEEHKSKKWYLPRDRTYKTNEAVKHAYRLSDIAVQCLRSRQ